MNQINISKLVLGPIRTNCYLVHKENTKECMIIDPADQADRIIAAINDELLEPVAVPLTHGHYDHIGAVEAVKRQFHVPVYAGSEEKEVLRNSYNNLSELMGEHPFIIDATDYLEDMQKLFLSGLNITALATPWHTKGGMSYLISCDGEQVLFSGDTLFQGSVGRYDFPTSNGRALFDSIKNKLLPLADDTPVFPGHGPATSIGEERTMF